MLYPAQNIEIERLYSQVLAGKPAAVGLLAASAGEGVTSLTLALAQRNLLAGHSTLVVDLNLYRPTLTPLLSLPPATHEDGLFCAPQLVGPGDEGIALTGIAAPRSREALIRLRTPGVLRAAIEQWQKNYHTILFDTSPLNRINAGNLPAEQVACACDINLMVVLSGQTTTAMVQDAQRKLEAAGATLSGCILNDRDNPSLRTELLRELKRLPRPLRLMQPWLQRQLQCNHLLSLEI